MNTSFFSHWSALTIWNPPWILPILSSWPLLSPKLRIRSTHITVTHANSRPKRRPEIYHTCSLDLPVGAVRQTQQGLVAGPELMFLQLAYDLTPHQLILLGYTLCATNIAGAQGPLTTVERLRSFAECMVRHRGRRHALHACRFIKNLAGSLPEILTAMRLSLPHRLGGAAMRHIELNQMIALNAEDGSLCAQRTFYVDLWDRATDTIIEYNGFMYHSSRDDRRRDAMRVLVLESMGYTVFTAIKEHVVDLRAHLKFLYGLQKARRRKPRIRCAAFVGQFRALHLAAAHAMHPDAASRYQWSDRCDGLLAQYLQRIR